MCAEGFLSPLFSFLAECLCVFKFVFCFFILRTYSLGGKSVFFYDAAWTDLVKQEEIKALS